MIRVILGGITWLVLILVLAIPLLILTFWKVLAIAVCYLIKNLGNGRRYYALPGSDSMLCPDSSEKRPLVNFGLLLVVEGSISADEFRQHFATIFINHNEGGRYEKLYSYLDTFGGYVFRVTNSEISLDQHILEKRLESGMKVEEFLAKWMLMGYKHNLPCWEMAVIPGLDGGMTGVAFKIHHAFADGYSVLHLLDKLTKNTSPYLVKDFTDGVGTEIRQMLEAPLNLDRMSVDPDENPFKVTLPADRQPLAIISFTSFPLAELKQIRREYDVHMSSVIFSLVGGALREFMLERDAHLKADQLPEYFAVGTTLPWPRHPARNSRTENKDKLCNHWVAAIFKVPLRESDPIQRLKKIEQELCTYLNLGLHKFMKRVLLPVLSLLPRIVLEKGMMDRDLGTGGGLTSLIGGDNYELLNRRVAHIHPFLNIHDNNPYMGLSCFTFTHSGKVELTMGAHPSVFTDQTALDNLCHKLCHNELRKFMDKKNV